jgi:hypothetical protein
MTFVLAAAVLAATAPIAPAAAASTDDTAPYLVDGVRTSDERTAVAGTGAAIDEVDDGTVLVTATPTEAQSIRRRGFRVTRLTLPASAPGARPYDFPPADSGYHNYAEQVAAMDRVAAQYPAIVRKFSLGKSYEGRDIWAVKIQ